MTVAVTLAGWLLIFGGYFAFAFLAAIAIGRFLRHGQGMAPVMQQRREQEARERALAMRQGPLSEWAAESLEKRQRAEARHAAYNDRDRAA